MTAGDIGASCCDVRRHSNKGAILRFLDFVFDHDQVRDPATPLSPPPGALATRSMATDTRRNKSVFGFYPLAGRRCPTQNAPRAQNT